MRACALVVWNGYAVGLRKMFEDVCQSGRLDNRETGFRRPDVL